MRAIAAIAAAHPDGEEVLVVCHGGVISSYLAHCLGLPLSGIWRLALANGSLTEVAPPRVLSVNEHRSPGRPRLPVRGCPEPLTGDRLGSDGRAGRGEASHRLSSSSCFRPSPEVWAGPGSESWRRKSFGFS